MSAGRHGENIVAIRARCLRLKMAAPSARDTRKVWRGGRGWSGLRTGCQDAWAFRRHADRAGPPRRPSRSNARLLHVKSLSLLLCSYSCRVLRGEIYVKEEASHSTPTGARSSAATESQASWRPGAQSRPRARPSTDRARTARQAFMSENRGAVSRTIIARPCAADDIGDLRRLQVLPSTDERLAIAGPGDRDAAARRVGGSWCRDDAILERASTPDGARRQNAPK